MDAVASAGAVLADAMALAVERNANAHENYTVLYRVHSEIIGKGVFAHVVYSVVRYTLAA